MIRRDLHNMLAFQNAMPPVTVSNNTAQTTAIIDTQDMMAVEFLIATGASLGSAGSTYAVTLVAGDAANLSDGAAPAATELLGTLAAASFTQAADQSSLKKLGYSGINRYVQMTITPTGNSAASTFGVAVVATPRIRGNAA